MPIGPAADYPGRVEILWWLAFPAAATLVAMVWAAWAGRPDREPSRRDSEQAFEQFAAAVAKPHPTAGRRVGPPQLGRVNGVALRRRSAGSTQQPGASRDDRR